MLFTSKKPQRNTLAYSVTGFCMNFKQSTSGLCVQEHTSIQLLQC